MEELDSKRNRERREEKEEEENNLKRPLPNSFTATLK